MRRLNFIIFVCQLSSNTSKAMRTAQHNQWMAQAHEYSNFFISMNIQCFTLNKTDS